MSTVKLCRLGESAGPIDAAVRRLLDRPAAELPFVIIEAVRSPIGRARFVQFAGSRSEPLRIDCPPLGVRCVPCPLGDAAAEARAALERQGVEPSTLVEVREDSQSHPPGGLGEPVPEGA